MKKIIILAVFFNYSIATYGDVKSDNFIIDLIKAAKERTFHDVTYDGSYYSISYPNGDVPTLYDLYGMPTSYLIDPEGVIRMVHIGFRDGDLEIVEEEIVKVLNSQ